MKSTCLTMSFISSLERGSVMKFWLLRATSVFSLHQSVKQQITRAGVGGNISTAVIIEGILSGGNRDVIRGERKGRQSAIDIRC